MILKELRKPNGVLIGEKERMKTLKVWMAFVKSLSWFRYVARPISSTYIIIGVFLLEQKVERKTEKMVKKIDLVPF